MIEAPTDTAFTFNDMSFGGMFRIPMLVHYQTGSHSTVTISGGKWSACESLGALFNNVAEQTACNFTGGLLVGALPFPSSGVAKLEWRGTTLGSFMAAANSTPSTTNYMMRTRVGITARTTYNQSIQGFVDTLNSKEWDFLTGPQNSFILMTNIAYAPTGPAFPSCDNMTFTYKAAQQTAGYGLAVGSLLVHAPTGTLFVVESVGAPGPDYAISTRQLNNMVVDTTGACVTNTISDVTLAGTTNIINTMAVIPSNAEYGNFTAGSNTITNVSNGSGFGGDLASYFAIGDRIWTYPTNETSLNWPYPNNTTLTTVTAANPGTLVMSGNATLTGRFPIFPFPVQSGLNQSFMTAGAKPTATGAGAPTCAAGAVAGGSLAGTVTLTAACAATNTLALTAMPTTTTGYSCVATDRTTPAALLQQTATTTTGVTFTFSGTTTGATDVIQFGPCFGY